MTKIQMSGSVLTVMWGQSEREEKHVDLSVQDCLGLSDSMNQGIQTVFNHS